MAELRLENIYKHYDEVTAVEDFNLQINDKEFVVLVGPSGCGKSTTLRMIAGLEEISEGRLYIGEHLVNDIPPKNRDIAMVFQNYALYPHMNVYKNMAFSLKFRKYNKQEIDKRVRDAAKILDIEHLLDRKPKQLSGGQRQRVALGRAIVREPKVFLMDEPLSNLDAKLRTQMRTEISKLHQRLQTTFIYVTHDQTEAMTMGTKIVVMKDGLIQQVASPEDVYNNPANLFVAGFIGSPAMNFIEGQLLSQDESITFSTERLKLKLSDLQAKKMKKQGYMNQKVVLGIRPENFVNEPDFLSSNPENCFEAKIEVVENMGSEYYLYFNNLTGKELTAKINTKGQRIFPGTAVTLGIDLEKCHFFDYNTQEKIAFLD